MFEKFNSKNVVVPITINTDETYYVNVNGLVYDKNMLPIETFINSEGLICVHLKIDNENVEFRIDYLVVRHFKYLDNSDENLMANIEAFYIDGNRNNLHASNLGYRFKTVPLESKFKDLYYIPGMPRRFISKDGIIYREENGKPVKIKMSINTHGNNKKNITGGYVTGVIELGNNTRVSIGRHRAMLLAFTHVPDNIESLVCNHINGIPGDDRLENLEWVTRKRNLAHAYENGLRSQNRPVLLKHVITGEILEFFSVAEAGRKIGVNDRGLNHMLEYRPFGSVNGKGYQIKYKDDTRDWVIFDNPEEMVKLAIQKIGVKARNCSTLEVYEFDSIGKASEFTKVKHATISYRFSKEDYSPLRNWQFIPDYLDDFPEFTEEQRLATLGPINYKAIARNLNTGETRYFDSVKKAGKSDIGIKNIADRIRKGQQPVVDNVWQFKLDDGSDWQAPKKDWFARSQPYAIYALDTKTGTVYVHNTIAELSRVLNVNKSTAGNKCDTGKLVENRYIFTRNKPVTL